MATTETTERPGLRRDSAALRQVALLRALATAWSAAGFDAFDALRPGLDRVDALERALRDRAHAAGELEREIAGRLVDGDIDVDGAAVELAGAATPRLDETVRRALTLLRRQLEQDAQRRALSAFAGLVAPMAEAVAAAVAAGRRCCDVDRVAKAFAGPEYRMLVPPLVADAASRPEWPAAVAATERVKDLRRLADMLPPVGGPAPRFWARRAIGEAGLVAELVPEPLILATGDALGWKPGLTADQGPVRPSDDDAGREARAELVRRAPAVGALQQRLTDLVVGRR